ncbi:MAG TPA: hypothetical protein VIL25_04050 [Vicinamibacterales bacterium]
MAHRSGSSLSLAETVRAACIRAAAAAYEDAGLQGLCAEGRWEAALSAMRDLDLSRVLDTPEGAVSGEKGD